MAGRQAIVAVVGIVCGFCPAAPAGSVSGVVTAEGGPVADEPCSRRPADLDGDCVVGINDLLILLGNWT